ncbi:ATP-dependent zinc metalloprotease FTSH [Pyrus ussuriensis x Pyrus communis]|uniref:ATP-dependent zinc metalloprotease FTSH n=1 Tax=Pyrus ussuriensis x Pyrus communis TaxID=2448454 RepID=A0A5N5HAH7_9ROSA|nr:ATP-dependent zinc metalloprotease FTSH [Pyrus ussuriensis x Pyrus communis]
MRSSNAWKFFRLSSSSLFIQPIHLLPSHTLLISRASSMKIYLWVNPGFVGADHANIINEADLLVGRGETVAREDVMEAIERAKFGINDKQLRPSIISKELGKMFDLMDAFSDGKELH